MTATKKQTSFFKFASFKKRKKKGGGGEISPTNKSVGKSGPWHNWKKKKPSQAENTLACLVTLNTKITEIQFIMICVTCFSTNQAKVTF